MKKYLISILITVVVMPQITFAAWWNPLSWFDEEKIEYQDQNISPEPSMENQTETTTPIPPTAGPEVIEKTVIKEVKVPVEKVVEKTVTVQDQTIVIENATLKNKINNLVASSTQCSAEIERLKKRIEELEAPLSQAELRKKDIITQIANIDLEITKVRNGYYKLCTSSCDGGAEEYYREQKIGHLEIQKAQLQLELSKL